MKLEDLRCPNCGGKVKINKEDDAARCDYCDSGFQIKYDDGEISLQKIEDLKNTILDLQSLMFGSSNNNDNK